MEKPKAKCAEIYHLNCRLEIICTICSESYERIHQFCNHLVKEHFNLQNDDFLGHFLEETKELDYQKLPFEIEFNNDNKSEDSSLNQQDGNMHLEGNTDFERIENSIDSVYLKVNSDQHLEDKINLEKVDSDINSVYFQYLQTNFEKSDHEIDILEETNCENSSKSQYLPQINCIMQPNGKTKNSKLENFVEQENGNFFCTICGNEISKFNLKKHDHSRLKHQCNICYKLFNSDISLSLHSRNYHKEENALEKILCELCGESISKSKLNYHLKLHDESRYLFQCDLCKKKFVSQNRLKNHVKVIHTKKYTSNKYKWIKKN